MPPETAPSLAVLSAMFFVSDRPLSLAELADTFERVDGVRPEPEALAAQLRVLQTQVAQAGMGIALERVAGGLQFRTSPEVAPYLRELAQRKPQKLTRAGLEVLAIVAYRQPCTRADVDAVRGVDSSSVLRSLLERDLVRTLGKSDEVGRPLVYGTTPTFLATFGLDSLQELPALRDVVELTEEERVLVAKAHGLDDELDDAQSDAPRGDETDADATPHGGAGPAGPDDDDDDHDDAFGPWAEPSETERRRGVDEGEME